MLYIHKNFAFKFQKIKKLFKTKIGIYAALSIYTDIKISFYIDSIKPSEYIFFLFSYKFRDHNQTSLFLCGITVFYILHFTI